MNTDEIYRLRNNFSIVGLTGRTGSGCTKFAEIISHKIDFDKTNIIRPPSKIKYIDPKDKNPLFDNNTVFKRKYQISYDYFKKNHSQYKSISYLSVIILYTINYGVRKKQIHSVESMIDYIYNIIKNNFKKSETEIDNEYKGSIVTIEEIESLSSDYTKLYESFKPITKSIDAMNNPDDLKLLYKCFFSQQFTLFAGRLFKLLSKRDYYQGAFLVHGLGNKIRATGDPTLVDRVDESKHNISSDFVYDLVKVINKLIKSWKANSQRKNCHIVIDSLRNSLEIMFLKERYSAFYMIAIHNDERCEKRIEERIKEITPKENQNGIEKIKEKVIWLDKGEHDGSSIKAGRFFAPDVENCIQKSEIHINNPGSKIEEFDEKEQRSNFYTMSEQWIKINALIHHPGLITPSQEERLMQIAFNTKFNSGCISRQVGAVITDKDQTVRSIGWNDVPKGSMPCNIRSLSDIINPNNINKLDLSYSPFEKEDTGKSYEDGGNFSLKTKAKFNETLKLTNTLCINHSYCFKTLHNNYEGKDNQVHTRSLHAEENAMLQISKFGGQPLKGGTLYTTASPCELCAKKAYQIGLSIVYIDPYPGISMKHILINGYNKPNIKMFTGIIGRAYNKLFEPLLSLKDELSLITGNKKEEAPDNMIKIKKLIKDIFGKEVKSEINIEEFEKKINFLFEK